MALAAWRSWWKAFTDNRTRTAADLRLAFGKNGGNTRETGCVGYLFEHRLWCGSTERIWPKRAAGELAGLEALVYELG